MQQVQDTWEFGFRPLRASIPDAPEPHLLLVAERSTGLIRSITVTGEEPTGEACRAIVAEAMLASSPHCQPCRPSALEVDSPASQMALTLALRNIDVALSRVRELPAVDHAVGSFQEHIDEDDSLGRLSSALCGHPEVLHAAARFAQLAPWKWLCDTDVIALRMDAGSWSAPVAVVMGAAEIVFGLALYRTRESYERVATGEDAEDAGSDALAVWFHPADEFKKADLEVFNASGFDAAGGLFPIFVRIPPEGATGLVSDVESAEILNLALPAVVAFLSEHQATLREGFSRLSCRHRAADGRVVDVESQPDWSPVDDTDGPAMPDMPTPDALLIDGSFAGLIDAIDTPTLVQISGLSAAELKRQGLPLTEGDLPFFAVRARSADLERWIEGLDERQVTKLLILPTPDMTAVVVLGISDPGNPTAIAVVPTDDVLDLSTMLRATLHGGRMALIFVKGPATKKIRTISSRSVRAVRFLDVVQPEDLQVDGAARHR